FTALSRADVSIISMRNKANRLEEMFVSMINQSTNAATNGNKAPVSIGVK
ncbi:MAG: ABC transporter ATP-binding protein, partial [Chitinophagaceae bacterium]